MSFVVKTKYTSNDEVHGNAGFCVRVNDNTFHRNAIDEKAIRVTIVTCGTHPSSQRSSYCLIQFGTKPSFSYIIIITTGMMEKEESILFRFAHMWIGKSSAMITHVTRCSYNEFLVCYISVRKERVWRERKSHPKLMGNKPNHVVNYCMH